MQEALGTAVELHSYFPLIYALPAAALLVLDAGEILGLAPADAGRVAVGRETIGPVLDVGIQAPPFVDHDDRGQRLDHVRRKHEMTVDQLVVDLGVANTDERVLLVGGFDDDPSQDTPSITLIRV